MVYTLYIDDEETVMVSQAEEFRGLLGVDTINIKNNSDEAGLNFQTTNNLIIYPYRRPDWFFSSFGRMNHFSYAWETNERSVSVSGTSQTRWSSTGRISRQI